MKQVQDLLNNFGSQLGGQASGMRQPGAALQQQPPSGFTLNGLLEGKGGLATGAVAGGLAGLLLGGKKSRKFAGNALKVGGIAVAGGLAFNAFQNWQRNKATAEPAPTADKFLPQAPAEQEKLAHHLIGAMIAAARADGHITPEEQSRIEAQLENLAMEEAAHIEIMALLNQPPSIDQLVAYAATPEEGAEIYTASLLVIDPEGPAEKGYLAMLAARLKLDPELVAHLHAQVDAIGHDD